MLGNGQDVYLLYLEIMLKTAIKKRNLEQEKALGIIERLIMKQTWSKLQLNRKKFCIVFGRE
jgi:hypothetical protein